MYFTVWCWYFNLSKGSKVTGESFPLRVCWLLPGCVARVCEREVADPQVVHGAQGGQAAVDGVTALHPDQTGCLVHVEGLHDVCAVQT